MSQKVLLSVSLTFSEPATISIGSPSSSQPLHLVAVIRQVASPFPDRPVTVLTKFSAFDTTVDEDAFLLRYMESPRGVEDQKREIAMYVKGSYPNRVRVTGAQNIRDRGDGFNFVTVPPVDQGSVEVTWSLPLDRVIFNPLSDSLESKLKAYKPGEQFKVTIRDDSVVWWTWGSLDSDLEHTKFSRWSFPEDLPLDRAPGADETEEVRHRLTDLIDLHDVNYLGSASAVPGEEVPDVKQLRNDGWAFGETVGSLEVQCDKEAVFGFVE